MELTGFPFWQIEYTGSDEPKICGYLHEAQQFAADHEIRSISFYVNVWFTTPGKGGLERTYAKRQMTKDEMLALTDAWLKARLAEARMSAQDYLETGRDT